MFYVYVLQSLKNSSLYIGYSSDLKKRIQAHISGKSTYTKRILPIKLIYLEGYINPTDAKKREAFLKSGSGWRFLKKQLVNYLKSTKSDESI